MTTLTPIEIPFTEAEMQLAEIFGKNRGMLELLRRCPECSELILVTDNSVWLDAKPVDQENHENPLAMGIMKMGTLSMAAGGDVQGGSKHLLHLHQPEEE